MKSACFPTRRTAIGAAVFSTIIFHSFSIQAAEPAVCPEVNAVVTAERSRDFDLACAGAADAIGYLEDMGLYVDIRFDIEIRDSVTMISDDKSLAFPVLGQFERATEKISVTSIDGQRRMASEKPIMGVVYDTAMFRSVVAHEVAHAIAHHNFGIADPSHAAHEYIAFAVQFETMPADLRERILASFTVSGFESEYDINPFSYHLSPNSFAIKVAHFHRTEDGGPELIRQFLQRDVLARHSLMMLSPPPL